MHGHHPLDAKLRINILTQSHKDQKKPSNARQSQTATYKTFYCSECRRQLTQHRHHMTQPQRILHRYNTVSTGRRIRIPVPRPLTDTQNNRTHAALANDRHQSFAKTERTEPTKPNQTESHPRVKILRPARPDRVAVQVVPPVAAVGVDRAASQPRGNDFGHVGVLDRQRSGDGARGSGEGPDPERDAPHFPVRGVGDAVACTQPRTDNLGKQVERC